MSVEQSPWGQMAGGSQAGCHRPLCGQCPPTPARGENFVYLTDAADFCFRKGHRQLLNSLSGVMGSLK